MHIKLFKQIFVSLLAVTFLVACGSKKGPDYSSGDDGVNGQGAQQVSASDTDGSGSQVTATGLGEHDDIAGQSAQSAESLRANNIIYFEFDRASVKQDFYDTLMAHAKFLSANADAKVRLNGHADERGTREYNLALGEQRAQSVAEILVLNGVAKDQLEVISYGEEAPAVLGHNDYAWDKNRRVEITY